MPISVLLADSHAVARRGLRSLLAWEGFHVVAEAADSSEAFRLAESVRPDVALLDLALPRVNGLDAARVIMQVSTETRTILMTQHAEERYVLEALRAGVLGYVLRRQAMSEVVPAIREVHRGRLYLSPAISRAVLRRYREPGGPTSSSLTSREREVLRLAADGRSTSQIAEGLDISVESAEAELRSVQRKLGTNAVVSLVRGEVPRGPNPH